MIKKENSRFLKSYKEINKTINSGRFDAALRDYDQLSKEYSKLGKNKSKNKLMFFNIRSQLLIYLKIKETENLLRRDNNLDLIKGNIGQLNSLYSEHSINKKILSYAKEKINYILDCYEYKLHKKELKNSLDEIYHCILKERYANA